MGIDVGVGVLGLAVLREDAGGDLVDLADQLEHGVLGHVLCGGGSAYSRPMTRLDRGDMESLTYSERTRAGPSSAGRSCGGRRGRSRGRHGRR